MLNFTLAVAAEPSYSPPRLTGTGRVRGNGAALWAGEAELPPPSRLRSNLLPLRGQCWWSLVPNAAPATAQQPRLQRSAGTGFKSRPCEYCGVALHLSGVKCIQSLLLKQQWAPKYAVRWSKRFKMILQSKFGHLLGRKVIPVSSGCSSDCLGKMEPIYGAWGFPAHRIPGIPLAKVLLLMEMQDPRQGSILKLCLCMVPEASSEFCLWSWWYFMHRNRAAFVHASA